jgi:hypothetical protein
MRTRLRLVPAVMALLFLACDPAASSGDVAPLTPQAITFEEITVNLLAIGQLSHKFSTGPPEDPVRSECYTHRSDTMEQVLCWTETEPGFEPNLSGAFTNLLYSTFQENFLAPRDYIASPRGVSGFQGIEFESYGRGAVPTTVRSLMWATSGNMWHLTFFFVTGNPNAEATVEAIFDSAELEGEADPVGIHGGVPEQPAPMPRGVERLLIQVTLEGDVYLNGIEASLDTVRQELRRLGKVSGVVLYDRAGGDSPPPEAESVSGKILFACGMAGVEIIWIGSVEE